MSRLDEIRARLDKATPGPWERCNPDGCWCGQIFAPGCIDEGEPFVDVKAIPYDDPAQVEWNAQLIAHAPEDLRLLLAIAEAARDLLAGWEQNDARFDWTRLTAALAALDTEPAS